MTEGTQSSFLDRTLKGAWRAIAGVARGMTNGELAPELPESDVARLKVQIHECLEAKGGEVTARARAANLGRTYLSLNPQGRRKFLGVLAREVHVDRDRVESAVADWQRAGTDDEKQHAERRLRVALRTPRFTLYKQFTALPDGVKFLVDLRAEVLEFRKQDELLGVLEAELKSLLLSWFDLGFLELQRIEWDSPASVLEKLIEYEAVHRIHDWEDMKNRLESDRRCFGFFHPGMPNEPLIFVEVALVSGMADNVQSLLDTSAPIIDPDTADAAIFYSISNAQKGLAGISFGDFLIKRVVDLLAGEFKGLKTFATLSPVPGFRRWLMAKLDALQDDADLLTPAESKKLAALVPDDAEHNNALRLALETEGWHNNADMAAALEAPLTRLCAQYLVNDKRDTGFASNPVAHFHLSNGARVERLNWLADSSDNGLSSSAGMMVNYLYRRADIEKNHEAYKGNGSVVSSSAVKALAKIKR